MYEKGVRRDHEDIRKVAELKRLEERVFYFYPRRAKGVKFQSLGLRRQYDSLRMSKPRGYDLTVQWPGQLDTLKQKILSEEAGVKV